MQALGTKGTRPVSAALTFEQENLGQLLRRLDVSIVRRPYPPFTGVILQHHPAEQPIPGLAGGAVKIVVAMNRPSDVDERCIRTNVLYFYLERLEDAVLQLQRVSKRMLRLYLIAPVPMTASNVDEIGVLAEQGDRCGHVA
jgi:hypothetical protein